MPRAPTISITCQTGEAYAAFLQKHLSAVCSHLKSAPREISVAIVGASTMSRLHEQFLGKHEATDVLSFELERDARGVTEGEIVICLDIAQEQSSGRGHAVEKELLLYALHGLLHLSGYDDLDDAGHGRMHAKEDEILEAIGVGPVFAPGARFHECCEASRKPLKCRHDLGEHVRGGERHTLLP